MRIIKIIRLQHNIINPIFFYFPFVTILCFGILDYFYSFPFLYKELIISFFSSWWLGLIIKETLLSNISIQTYKKDSHLIFTFIEYTFLYVAYISLVIIITTESPSFLLVLLVSQILFLSSLSLFCTFLIKNHDIGLYSPIFYIISSHFSILDKFNIHDIFLKLIYFYPSETAIQTIILNLTYTITFILISFLLINFKKTRPN